jgi:hypothetical protein
MAYFFVVINQTEFWYKFTDVSEVFAASIIRATHRPDYGLHFGK